MDRALVKDLEAVGVPWEMDLSFPCPVRWQSALYVALGSLCKRLENEVLPKWPRLWLESLKRRVSAALDVVQAIGKRSRFAGWFR